MSIKNGLFCSVKEAADKLGCTDAHVRRLLIAGQLRGRKFTETSWAVEEDSVREYSHREITTGRPRKNSS